MATPKEIFSPTEAYIAGYKECGKKIAEIGNIIVPPGAITPVTKTHISYNPGIPAIVTVKLRNSSNISIELKGTDPHVQQQYNTAGLENRITVERSQKSDGESDRELKEEHIVVKKIPFEKGKTEEDSHWLVEYKGPNKNPTCTDWKKRYPDLNFEPVVPKKR